MNNRSEQIILFIVVTTAIVLSLVILILILLSFYQKKQLLYTKQLRDLQLEFDNNLLISQIEVQEQTFLHISREIHDNINLSLTLAKLNLNTLDWSNVGKTQTSVRSSIDILTSAIGDLSNLSKSINKELIADMGLIKAVKIETDRVRNFAGLIVCYEVVGEAIFLESEKELIIFRVVQEALNNILRHSKANRISVVLKYNPADLTVTVRDNGMGFDREAITAWKDSGKAGLKNMESRTQLLGGVFSVNSLPHHGTTIKLIIPY